MTSHQRRDGSQSFMWVPEAPEERDAIRRDVEQILASEFFRNSRRYPRFLQYVVEETLAGRGDQVKERTLGIEVFGREPDYDTNLDHIVRSTATEVRRRLKLYYQKNGSASGIRIDLPQRSYRPLFLRAANQGHEPEVSLFAPRATPAIRKWSVYAALAAIIFFLVGLGTGYFVVPPATVSAKTRPVPPASLVDLLTVGQAQHVDAVLGDTTLETLNTQIPGNFVSLAEYENPRIFETGPELKASSGPSDWTVVREVGELHMQLISRIFRSMSPGRVSLSTPSEITAQDFQHHNMLLIEGPRVNPWVQIFESHLNFRTEVPKDSYVADIRDVAPRAGEEGVYTDVAATGSRPGRFYGHIAYLPPTSSHQRVLIVSGPESSYMTLSFATNPATLPEILRVLRTNRLNPQRSFELLLEFTGAKDSTLSKAKIVAFRGGR